MPVKLLKISDICWSCSIASFSKLLVAASLTFQSSPQLPRSSVENALTISQFFLYFKKRTKIDNQKRMKLSQDPCFCPAGGDKHMFLSASWREIKRRFERFENATYKTSNPRAEPVFIELITNSAQQ